MSGSIETMRAAIYRRQGEVDITETAVPDDGGVLIAVEYCGICGTDLHMILDGWGAPDSVYGHEWSGRVVDAGQGELPVGTLVVGTPSETCGDCEQCRAGRPSLCAARPEAGAAPVRGAFAEYVRVPRELLVPVPDGIDARSAAYAEPLAVALHAITVSAITADQTALVVGAGPIGAAIIAVLHSRGIATAAVEPGERRRRLAEQLGATARTPEDLEIPAHPGHSPHDAVDVVFETSGARVAAESGLTQLTAGGTLVLVGTGLDAPKLDSNRMILNELTVTGAFNYDADGFAAALALIGSGRLPMDHLLAPDDTDLDELLSTMQRLRSGEIPGKAMVRTHG